MNKTSLYGCSVFLLLIISGCDKPDQTIKHSPQEQAEIQQYIKKVKADQVYVKGGIFWMGDFCKKFRDGGSYCSPEKDTKPLHEVELSSYSISKFKTTHEDYNFYLKMVGLPRQYSSDKSMNEMLLEMTHFKNSPAVVTWTEADNYCAWLKKETGLPFTLPTEAQWEYAARSRGKYILVATDDGVWREDEKGYGENYATDKDRYKIEKTYGINGSLALLSVDKYPPTPFGLYGMSDNGYEWVQDWYDPGYYENSPRKDPRGPDKPIVKDKKTGQYFKVRRGGVSPDPTGDVGLTFFRGYNRQNNDFPDGTTVRCVVNSSEPVK
ncbi:formylglycine-generating enzyme family protein [Escherichia coli]|nr:formylglycine-generating enzyme family protein [Escherichia coli]EFE3481804.1 formylglycine-generating enzyme family protein [Escherichia coli]EFI1482281.1 formylglycine-generating enzyme family protein [Escherichia coli]EIQ0789242.1 SUMF1/EgtB/PvdO family nonheme iron enzyme [Escherichia coli]EIQ2011535.1 SUMF1/EgtB/PvdO family nonheme iron enzyme [Escherichia coli]